MTAAPELPLCDALAMNRFHRIFREAHDAVPRFVGDAPADDSARAEHVGSYYDNVLRLLHAHHEGEDLTIYPMMVERLPEHLDVINRVNAEHDAVLGTLERGAQADHGSLGHHAATASPREPASRREATDSERLWSL